MPEWSVYSTVSYKENSFFLKGLVSLKCTKWQKAKGSWCLSNQDWAVPVCISISANRSKCYWSFCAVKLLLSCPLHLTIGILGLLGAREVVLPASQISTFLRKGRTSGVKLLGLLRGSGQWAQVSGASGQRKRLNRKSSAVIFRIKHWDLDSYSFTIIFKCLKK